MQPGEMLDVVCLEGNVSETAEINGMKDDHAYKPSDFFTGSRAKIWRQNDTDLNIQFKYNHDDEKYNTEFDIEWKVCDNHSHWFPLRNGIYDNTKVPPNENQVRNWSEFPNNTHIGLLSGPIILWRHVDLFPLVTFNKNKQ